MTIDEKLEFINEWLLEKYPEDGVGVACPPGPVFNPYCFTQLDGYKDNIRFDIYLDRKALKPCRTREQVIELIETEIAIYTVTK